MSEAKAQLQRVAAYAGRDRLEMRNKTVSQMVQKAPDGHGFLFGGFA
jgi:hypothetical protein